MKGRFRLRIGWMTAARLAAPVLAWCCLFFAAPSAIAQNLERMVVEHRLKNGMRFLFVRRPETPVFSAAINFRVGSVDEHVGITGLAHMFEHMAFKGTRVIGTKDHAAEVPLMKKADAIAERLRRHLAGPAPDPKKTTELRKSLAVTEGAARRVTVKDELDEIYSRQGASGLNAFTASDFTSYIVSLPSNRFEMWALIESQRIADPVLREFYSERDVVAEERRLRTETNPDGRLYEEMLAAAFMAHPYGYPGIGWMSDVLSLTREQAIAFRKIYYTPGNAVAAIVGDVDPKTAIPIVEKYFGPIPAGSAPPPLPTKEPEQRGERRVSVSFDAQPQVAIGYHKPPLPTFDDAVFTVIDQLLTEGRTSRLYTTLVKEKRIATGVGSYQGVPGDRYPNLYYLEAVPRHPHTAAEVEEALLAELERIKDAPVTQEELQKAKNNVEANFVYAMQSNMGLVSQLGFFQTVAGDWRELIRWRDRVLRVTAEDIQRVAKRYLTAENRTVGTVVPARPPDAPAGATGSPGGPPGDGGTGGGGESGAGEGGAGGTGGETEAGNER